MTTQSDQSDAKIPSPAPSQIDPTPPIQMPKRFFALSMLYLVLMVAVFVVYACSASFRANAPKTLGPLPVGVVWFGGIGAVLSGVRGTFLYNHDWHHSYDYWYYSRPLFGAVSGAIGALIYWVSLRLGNTSAVTVDRSTFYVVAFLLGFADNAFFELLTNVTNVVLKPGKAAP